MFVLFVDSNKLRRSECKFDSQKSQDFSNTDFICLTSSVEKCDVAKTKLMSSQPCTCPKEQVTVWLLWPCGIPVGLILLFHRCQCSWLSNGQQVNVIINFFFSSSSSFFPHSFFIGRVSNPFLPSSSLGHAQCFFSHVL